MIRRRLVEHIRTQNWLAVCLDFLIVVLGVFIGIQLGNWNEARQTRLSERAFLQRLHDDVVQLQERRASYDRNRPLAVRVQKEIMAFLGGERRDLSAAEQIFFEAFPQIRNVDGLAESLACGSVIGSAALTVPPATLPTATELLSAGRIGDIESSEVKTALQTYLQQADRAQAYIAAVEKNTVRLSALFPQMFRIRRHDWGVELDGTTFSQNSCDYEAMRSDNAFMNAMTVNFYSYEQYTTVGILPASAELTLLHQALDRQLDIVHREGDEAPPK